MDSPPSNAAGPRRRLFFAFLGVALLSLAAWKWRASWSEQSRKDPYPASTNLPANTVAADPAVSRFDDQLSPATKAHIDQWIQQQGLNRFGDPQGSMYLGGTPLFDEKTGRTKGRYEYILEKHPELRPSLPGVPTVGPSTSAPPTPGALGRPEALPQTTNAHP